MGGSFCNTYSEEQWGGKTLTTGLCPKENRQTALRAWKNLYNRAFGAMEMHPFCRLRRRCSRKRWDNQIDRIDYFSLNMATSWARFWTSSFL